MKHKKEETIEYTDVYKCYCCITKPICSAIRLRECGLCEDDWMQSMFILPLLFVLRDINIRVLEKVVYIESRESLDSGPTALYSLSVPKITDITAYAFLDDGTYITLQYDRNKWKNYNKKRLLGDLRQKTQTYIEATTKELKKDVIYGGDI